MATETQVSQPGEKSSADDVSRTNRNTKAEALLRTITGVTDARIVEHPAGGIAVVRVLCNEEEASTGQIVRNVRSALIAGFGIAVSSECIDFVPAHELAESQATAAAAVPRQVVAAKHDDGAPPAPEPKVSARPVPITGTPVEQYIYPTAPHSRDTGAVTQTARATRILQAVAEEVEAEQSRALPVTPVPATVAPVGNIVRDIVASAASLRLESVEMRRQSGRLRCRVVISLGADHFGAVADSSDPNAGEIHLAGRVACDALRAGGFTDARFDGAAVAHINGRQHVVVALSEWMGGETIVLSGAAPLEDVPERAAAIAAIKAVLAQDVN